MENSLLTEPAIIWLIIGIACLVLEFVVPGLIIFFFGIGGLLTAGISLFTDINLTIQLLIFIITTSVSLALFRKSLKKKFFNTSLENEDELTDEFIGKKAVALIDFKNSEGKVEFKGTTWKAISTEDVVSGQNVIIEKIDSITLYVKPI